MDTYAYTLAGQGRKINEDRYLIKSNGKAAVILAIADGLGGEVAGDYAADTIREMLVKAADNFIGDAIQLKDIIMKTDRFLRDKADLDDALEGMGTTATCVCFHDSIAHWAHVGDSRFYLLRNRELTQLTRDQTMARFLVEEGEITEAEALTHNARHHLEQSVGCGTCEPDLGHLRIEPGDLFLLTTDGIHGSITNEKIYPSLCAKTDLKTKAMALIQVALDAGGGDDMTVVIAQVGE